MGSRRPSPSRYEIASEPEARRLAYVVDEGLQSLDMTLTPGDLIALGQLHATLALGEKIDRLTALLRPR